ncbi:hypothetical protein [Candidatus Nitrosotenuis uzonensis]|uniref:Uncharacterized protein n=1 Tax=Candidatus Nitrosotenuis uzonensis TaxID=1407055 RepID=V6ASW6_9ARCH|nr:hypothetical protein [Candidatus Nitrosotenuis uzonensis]CDI05659.1 hypothetical protein NITUZ_30351 [Candidatus Nitrosotenuis uzonensis]
MRIGNNELVIIALLQKYPRLNESEIQYLFTSVTGKKIRVKKILQSLRIKDVVDKNFNLDLAAVEKYSLPEINIESETLLNLQQIDENFKMGSDAKATLYILSKINKASLQFLANFFHKPIPNTYAILERLEEKNLVYGYHSRIKHVNSMGKGFRPKYYTITDLGRTICKIKADDSINKSEIDQMLNVTHTEIEAMKADFKPI